MTIMENENGRISEKISDLTESLYRTTDVLSSADRMIDHYRGLNKEQEHEIARLRGTLHKTTRNRKSANKDGGYHSRSHSSLLQDDLDGSLSSNEDNLLKNLQHSKSKVHFKENLHNTKLTSLEATLNHVNQRQSMLEEELLDKDRLRERDLERFDTTLKNELSSLKDETRKQTALDDRLKQLQEKIESDHNNWRSQQKEMQNLTKEMTSLKEVVKEVATPKKNSTKSLADDRDIKDEMDRFKKRISKDKEIIVMLQEEIRRKDQDKISFESTVNEIRNIGNMKNNQLKLLEQQLEKEKSERSLMERSVQDLRQKTNDMDRERTEVLERFAGIKTESKVQMEALEKLSQNNTELKLLLERSEHQRDKLSDHVFKLKTSNEAKNQHIGNLESDLSTCHRQLTSLENDRSQSSKRYENNENVIKDIRKELAEVKNLYSQSELRYKEIEKSKQELKEKAVHTLKEYRLKCKRYEQRCDDLSEQVKLKDANLAKESSRAKEIEIANLKLQKEYQDLSCEFENLQQQFSGRDKRLSQLLDDRNHVEHVLQEANHASKANNELRKEIQDLKNDKMTLNSQLLDEKRKVKEFESLLHENYERQLETKDSVTSLQRQLQEERQMKTELASRLQQEKNSSARHDVRRLEERNTKLESDKNEMHQKLIKLEKLQEDFSRNMQFFEKDKSDSETKEKALTQKLKKSSDDTSRMRKQYQSMKKTYEEKIQELRTSVTKSEEQMSILQNHSNEYQSEISKLKDVIKVIISLVTRDLENLLNLLCREDENMMPVKEIPDSMSPEHQKSLHEIREKIQSCYSISKTLKQKFQHQKSFVRKAQEKIKKQSHEQESFKEELSSENEKLTHHIHKLEKNRTIHEEDRKRIAHLQRQVKELTKHLEECTNALEKSLSFEEDRRKVLKELDELKNEHQERQKTDESYYRNNEKVDILTEQLNDAKKTLEDVKQETLDSTVFTSRVLESFSSVSPSCRKRSLLSQATPKLKSSRGSLFRDSSSYIPTYIDELESTPTRDVHKRRTPPTKGRRKEPVPDLNDVDPMSMTDDEFDKIFMPKKTNSDHSSPLHLPKAGQMTNGIGGPDTNHPLGS